MHGAWLALLLLWASGAAIPAAAQSGAWIGAVGSGCQVWDATPMPGRSVIWSGACRAGRASGPGALSWFRDGIAAGRYSGDMHDGRRHGRGTWLAADGTRREGLYYRDRLAVRGSIKQGILIRAAPVPADSPGATDGACALEIVASSALAQPVGILAGLLMIRRDGTLLASRKVNLDGLAPGELRVATVDYRGCEKPAGPRDRVTVELWEISLCDIGGRPRSDCDRLITFTGDDDDANGEAPQSEPR